MSIDSNLTLGQYLRHERECRGLTIEQVASATKIGIRTLHALEGDHYAELPAKPFIRGFVISYSRFVGLDHKETLTHFNSFLDERVQQERPNREGGHSGYAFERRESDQSRMFLGITMGSFVLIGAVALIFLKPSLKHHHGSHLDKLRAVHETPTGALAEIQGAPQDQDSGKSNGAGAQNSGQNKPTAGQSIGPILAAAPSNSVIATPSSSEGKQVASATTSSGATPSPGPSAAPVSAVPDPLNSGFGLKPSETSQRVVCKALESVWVRYRVDEKDVMQFILKKDKVLVLRGRKSVVLQIGEPDHLNLSINGGPYHAAAADKAVSMRQNDATLFFPSQLAKITNEPFHGEKPLSSRKSPATPASAEASPLNP